MPTDVATVSTLLADAKPAIDPVWLFDLVSTGVAAASAPYYAEQVRTAAGLRAITAAGVAIQQIGATPGDLDKRREEARQRIDEACRGRKKSTARKLAALLPAAIDAAQSGQTGVLSTCWPDIDRAIGGLAPGRLIVIGARPGGGKSLSGTNLALHMAHHHGHAVLLASLEMPEIEVVNRLLSAHAEVGLRGLADGEVPESDWEKVAAKHAELEAMPIYIEGEHELTVQGLRRIARDIQRERDDLALIVVDYLQLMQPAPTRRNASRAEEISQISRDLKLLARETGACVVAMAQVNREGGKNDDGPRLTDIREGGAENDADQVILLHRPDLDLPQVVAKIAKNRHGPQAEASLLLQGHYARLVSETWSPTRAALGSA